MQNSGTLLVLIIDESSGAYAFPRCVRFSNPPRHYGTVIAIVNTAGSHWLIQVAATELIVFSLKDITHSKP